MRVRVRFLSYLRDMIGVNASVLEVNRQCTLGELVELMMDKWPILRKIDLRGEGPIIVLLNNRTASPNTPVNDDDDEVTVIPPATGG